MDNYSFHEDLENHIVGKISEILSTISFTILSNYAPKYGDTVFKDGAIYECVSSKDDSSEGEASYSKIELHRVL